MNGILSMVPDPALAGYPWGLFSAKEKAPITRRLFCVLEASRSSTTRVVSRGDTRETLLAAIYPLQLTNYLYSSISFIISQVYFCNSYITEVVNEYK